MLIGAGCVETLETSAVSLGEFGLAPRFTAAILAGTIRMKDATCPALHAAFQAAEKGVPFMPLRGLIGSDVLAHRPDWKMIANPFGETTIRSYCCPRSSRTSRCSTRRWPTVTAMSGSAGSANCSTMAHAAKTTVVTVENIHAGNLLDDPKLAAGTVPGFYVEAVAVAEKGAWPLPLPDHYAWDAAHLAEYARLAATDEGFAQYLKQHVHERHAA